MLCMCSGKYIDIYFIMKITYYYRIIKCKHYEQAPFALFTFSADQDYHVADAR